MTSLRSRRSRVNPVPPTRYRLWYGRDEPPVAERTLRAGPVSAVLIGPELAHVRLGDVELVDRVYMSVRDRNWDTIGPVLSAVTTRDEAGTTITTFDARNQAGDIDVRWRGTVTAEPDGTLTYAMDGEAGGDFEYCRIGFCVLHPAATAAGRPFRASTIEGEIAGELPGLIAPQSIVDGVEVPLFPACRRLEVDLDGVTTAAEFEGDLFEMEDQRNWTDASFKTYCTPIALGYPHRAQRGQRFHQVVRLRLAGGPASAPRTPARSTPRSIDVGAAADQGQPAPLLGVGAASWLGRGLTSREARRLRAIGLDHLRTDVRLSAPDWPARLDDAMRDAVSIGAQLEVALFVGEATVDRLPALAGTLAGHRLARVLVFHEPTAGTRSTPAGWVTRARDALGDAVPGVSYATGTDGDFAELNRDRPDLAAADAVSYAMNPQIHAFDEASMAQTLEIQATTVATARTFAAGRAVVVSPVTLRQRFNPAAADPATDDTSVAAPARMPAGIDARQPTLFAAGWTLGSYAALAGAGAASVTYFETVGPRGLMSAARGPVSGDRLPAGGVFPVYHVMADLGGGAGWSCAPLLRDGGPSDVAGLVMRRDGQLRVLVANMRPETRTLTLHLPRSSRLRLRLLDERNALAAMAAPARYRASASQALPAREPVTVRLLPYAIARIDALTG